MAADPNAPGGINSTIASNITTNNRGAITGAIMAATLGTSGITAWVYANYAPLISPTFTGTVTLPPGTAASNLNGAPFSITQEQAFGVSPSFNYTPAQFYVTTTGSDANPCTLALPCLTVTRGVAAATSHDASGKFVYLNIGAGTFAGSLISGSMRGQAGTNISNAYLVLKGSGSGITTITDTGSGYAVEASGAAVIVQAMKIQAPQAGGGIFSQNHAVVQIGSDVILSGGASTPTAANYAIHSEGNAIVEVASGNNFTISGVFGYLYTGGVTGYFELDPGSGIITCASCDVNTSLYSMNGNSSALIGTGWSFSGFGSITGKRYTLQGNAVIENYAGVTLPGSTGLVATGGRINPSPVVSTVTGTGLGTGYSCAPQAATVRSGIIICTTGTTPSASGTLTITMPEVLYSNSDFTKIAGCSAGLVNGSGSWGAAGSSVQPANIPGTSLVLAWTNGAASYTATALTAALTYSFSYTCNG